MITIADIAARMQISTATVSNALTGKGRVNEEKRKAIITVAQEMGYDFSRIRSSHARKNIVVITEQIGITFCDRIVQGICSAATEHHAQVTIYNMNILTLIDWRFNPPMDLLRQEAQKLFERLDSSCMGLIYVSQYPRDLSNFLPALPVPVICTYAYTGNGVPCINYDDQQGAFLATSHLASLGRKRIAMISGVVDSIPMTKRFAGYQRALIHAGLDFSLDYVRIGRWNEFSGEQAMEELLNLPVPPDAVFCQSDYIAIGAMRAVTKAGLRIPEDIAIVGFDDIDAACMVTPQLTTIAPPHVEIGQEAVHKLMRILDKADDGKPSIKLECWLLKRDSA